jgi:hypothetical protein
MIGQGEILASPLAMAGVAATVADAAGTRHGSSPPTRAEAAHRFPRASWTNSAR